MKISPQDIDHIALGGSFLATGGGGDLLIGRILTKEALKSTGEVELISLDSLADDALVAVVGGVGAPTILLEKTTNGQEPIWALEALERHLGRKVDALVPMEAGGLNALAPFPPAGVRGLPVVDADGMGRAFPELQMESFSIYGVSATPLALASELGDTQIVEHTRGPVVAERLVRDFAMIAGGGHCISAEHVMDGATAKRVCVPATISLCRDIGELLTRLRGDLPGFLTALQDRLAPTHYGVCRKLFEGKVVDVSRRIDRGFDIGEVTIEAFDDPHRSACIQFQNEYLILRENGTIRALVPDLIILVDNETVEPVTAEKVRYGQRVAAIGIGAPALMRTREALKWVAPRCFGIDEKYVRLEDLE